MKEFCLQSQNNAELVSHVRIVLNILSSAVTVINDGKKLINSTISNFSHILANQSDYKFSLNLFNFTVF